MIRITSILLILFFLSTPLFSKDIKQYLPFDTFLYADLELKNYNENLEKLAYKFIPSTKVNEMSEGLSEFLDEELGIDFFNTQVLAENGIDLSDRAYFALSDTVISKDFSLLFVFGLKIKDQEKAKVLVESVSHKVLSNPVYDIEEYKGQKITTISKELAISLNLPKTLTLPTIFKESSLKQDNIQLLDNEINHRILKQIQYAYNKESQNMPEKLFIKSFSYVFIDDYLFIGPLTAIKKIIDTVKYSESFENNRDFKITMSKLDTDSRLRIFLSYKNLSPILFTEFLDRTHGIGLSFDFNESEVSFKAAYKLNPNSSSYYRSKELFTINRPSANYLEYLPEGDFNFTNLRVNMRQSLKSLPWYWDLYLIYSMSVFIWYDYYTNPLALYGMKMPQENTVSLTDKLKDNSFDILKDYLNNIGNDFNLVTLLNEPLAKGPNILAFSEIDSKINGYKLINKVLNIFKSNNPNLDVKEMKFFGQYFYRFPLQRQIPVYLGVYNKHLILATNEDSLKEFLTNIKNRNAAIYKSLKYKALVEKIKRSYFNLFITFKGKNNPFNFAVPPRILNNLDYLHISQEVEGDFFLTEYKLKF